MAVRGPGANIQVAVDVKPLLWFATDQDVIQIFNPLTDDFTALIGKSVGVDQPFELRKTPGAEAPSSNESDAQRNYGLNLKNADHRSVANITTTVTLPAGSTTNHLGGAAKVIVTQLVNEMMQLEKHSIKMADPTARNQYEQRIIVGQRKVTDIMDNYQTENQQVTQAINQLNESQNHEQAFPTETSRTVSRPDDSVRKPDTTLQRRGPGRPKASTVA